MNEPYINKLLKMVEEVVAEGYGEINLKIIIKNSKVEHIGLTKELTYKIDSQAKKEYI